MPSNGLFTEKTSQKDLANGESEEQPRSKSGIFIHPDISKKYSHVMDQKVKISQLLEHNRITKTQPFKKGGRHSLNDNQSRSTNMKIDEHTSCESP